MQFKVVRRSRRKSFLYSILGLILTTLLSFLVRYFRRNENDFNEPFNAYASDYYNRKKGYKNYSPKNVK